MCEFCESLIDKEKEITWSVRSIMADDNICEFVNENKCNICGGCKMYFTLSGRKYEDLGEVYVDMAYTQKLKSKDGREVVIRPFSEGIQWNFCPVCGIQISKTIKSWEEYYDHQISINDKE